MTVGPGGDFSRLWTYFDACFFFFFESYLKCKSNEVKYNKIFQWWFLLGNHNHQANPHVHQQHIAWTTTFRSGLAQPLSSQMAWRERKPTKRFRHAFVIFESNFALKDVRISCRPWSIATKDRWKLCAEVFLFHQVLFMKEQFFLVYRFPKKPTRCQNIWISRLHWAFSPLLVWNIRLVRFGYFFYPLSYLDVFFFYPDSYGNDIRFTTTWCKREAYLNKNLSDFVPIRFTSDSDPLHFCTKGCVYTERIANFVRARSVVSCEKRLFSVLFASFGNFC